MSAFGAAARLLSQCRCNRRRRVALSLTSAVVLMLSGVASAAAETATGFVFEDLDRDSQFDSAEPGIAGVRVSNGRDVVVTDRFGRYSLPVQGDAVVFITKPSGYATPVDADQLPRFYYIHRPTGSAPGLRFPGVAPTGPLPAQIDFPLIRRAEPRSFEVLLFSDTQPQSAAEVDWIRDTAVQELLGQRAAFGMTMGDILFDDLSLFPRLNRVIGKIGVPWYNVPGNHEIDYSARGDADSLETFTRWYGPSYYAFEYGEALFVVLDNIEYRGASDAEYPAGLRAGGTFVASISPQQLSWLAKELAQVPREKLIVLTMHSPLRTAVGEPERPQANVANRRALFQVLKDRPHVFALAGHTHMTEHMYFGAADGWPNSTELHQHMLATVSGSWWSGPLDAAGVPVSDLRDGTPRGYHIMQIDGTNVRVRFKAVGRPADEQMRITFDVWHNAGRADIYRDVRPGALIDGRFGTDEVDSTAIVVNLFDGGPRSRLEYAVDAGPWMPMQRRFVPDPYIVESFARHRSTVKSWVTPQPSTHLWVAPLPRGLDAGTYTLDVRAIDEYGAEHRTRRVFEIMGTSAPRIAPLGYPR